MKLDVPAIQTVDQMIVSVLVLEIVVHVTIHKEKRKGEIKMSNKTRKVAEVELVGNEYKIVSIITSHIANEKGKTYFQLSDPLANSILVQMDKGRTAYFSKDLKAVKQDDLIYKESSDLDIRKNNEISKYMRMISELFTNTSFMDFFDFMVMNNKFCFKGIFITDDNREESYLKVINTGDENLIENLEDFLEAYDSIDHINQRYKKIKHVIHKINDCQTIEDLEELVSANHQL